MSNTSSPKRSPVPSLEVPVQGSSKNEPNVTDVKDVVQEDDVFHASDPEEEEDDKSSVSSEGNAAAPSNDAEQRHLARLAGETNLESLTFLPSDLFALPEWSKDYPDNAEGGTRVSIQHAIQSLNRRVEAAARTDAVILDMSVVQLLDNQASPHTRVFEAIGHYIPNLLRAHNGEFQAARVKYTRLTGNPSAFRLTTQHAPAHKGWVRYRLVNGKYAEFRTSREAPNFVIFGALSHLFSLPCAGIKMGLDKATIDQLEYGPPKSVGELFDEAVDRAGGVDKVNLLPYSRPSLESHGDSKMLSSWLALRAKHEPRVELPAAASKADAVRTVMKHLREHSLTDSAEEYLDIVVTLLGEDPSDDLLESVYEHMVPHFDAFDWAEESEEIQPIDLGQWASPDSPDTEEDVGGEASIEVSIGGTTSQVLVATYPGPGYSLPYPAFLAPEGCGYAAMSVLALYPSVHHMLEVKHASYTGDFPWYALSVTPRKITDARGRNLAEPVWHEKMCAHVDFDGPVFLPRRATQPDHVTMARLLNTAWLEEVVSLGHVRSFPRVYAWPGAALTSPSIRALPDNARGLGVVDGRLTLSPLLKQRAQWEDHFLQDLRCVIPVAVLRVVVNHPENYAIKSLSAYLEGLGPLVIVAKHGHEEVEFVYSEGVTFNPRGSSAKELFHWDDDTISVDNENGGARIRIPTVPPRAIKDRDATDADWGIPKDANDVSWQTKVSPSWVPHESVEMFAEKLTVNSVGNWTAIIPQLGAAGVSPEYVKHLYSVHWQTANGPKAHPVCRYHNPVWTATLKGRPVRRELWYWPTGKVAPNPLLSANDSGQLPLTGQSLVTHKQRLARQQNAQWWYHNNASRGSRGGRGRGQYPRQLNAPRGGSGSSTQGSLTARLLEHEHPDETNVTPPQFL